LALNGPRVSEALDAAIADLDMDRGHRTLRIVRKGGNHVTITLTLRAARALDLYIGERTVVPTFVTADGDRWTDRYRPERGVSYSRQRGCTVGRRAVRRYRRPVRLTRRRARKWSGSAQ
jgi:integrase